MFKFRLVYALAFLFFAGVLTAQTMRPIAAEVNHYQSQNGQFHSTELFTPQSIDDEKVRDFAQESQGLKLNPKKLANLLAGRPEGLTLTLPYNGENIKVLMVRTEVVSEDFAVITSESNGQPVAVTQGLHYRGVVDNNPESIVAFSFFDDDVMGLISTADRGNMVLGQLDARINPDGSQYIFYQDNQLSSASDFECHTPEDDGLQLPEAAERSVQEVLVNGCVRVFLEADFELYQNKGSNVTNTVNYMTGIFNQVKTLFANETISTVISGTFVWTTADSYSNTNVNTALEQFRTLRTSFTGDVAHLVSLGGQGLGGLAHVNVLCNTAWRYGYTNIWASYSNVPTYSWSVGGMVHELGHNMGSNHTHWCGWTGGALDNCWAVEGSCAPGPAPVNGGTIMSYCHVATPGINFNNGFGTQPGNIIRTRVAAATCLAATCGGSTACTDQQEPNGAQSTAKVLTTNTNFKALIASATDVDWYKFSNTTAAKNIKVELTTLPTDYDLKLYRGTTQLGTSELAGTSSEKIIYNTTTVATNYYAYVKGFNGAFNTTTCYTLRVSISNTAWWFNDEPEDRDAQTFEVPVVFESMGFGMYPNPAADQVTIEVPAGQETEAIVMITDVAGRVISHQKRTMKEEEDNQFVFDLAAFKKGLYFVNVRCGENNHTRTLTVQR